MTAGPENQIPVLSVIIATCKRKESLQRLLVRLERQANIERGSIEIIVVDNDGAASARKTVEDWAKRTEYFVRYICETRAGKVFALETGMKAAMAKWLLFFDDDVLPAPAHIKSYLDAIQNHPEAWGFGGPVHSCCDDVPGSYGLSGRYRLYLAWPNHYLGSNKRPYQAGESPMGANRVLHRRIFDSGERFRTEFALAGLPASPEDDIGIGSRLIAAGREIVYIPDAEVSHFVPRDTFEKKNLWKRYHNYGRYLYYRDLPQSRVFRKYRFRIKKALLDGIKCALAFLTCRCQAFHYHYCEFANECGYFAALLEGKRTL